MSKAKYDVPRVRTSLEALGKQFPDRYDQRVAAGHKPRYFYHGDPSCLGAYLLLDLGFSEKTIKHLDDGESVQVQAAAFRKRFTPEAWALVEWVQKHNDGARHWGWIAAEAFNNKSWTGNVLHPDNSIYRLRPWLEKPTGAALDYAQRYGVGRLA